MDLSGGSTLAPETISIPGLARDRVSRKALAVGLSVTAILLAVKLSAPDSLDSLDQAKQALYVVDAYREGRWLVPLEQATFYPTKPPLMTWISLVFAILSGGASEIVARAPSFLGAAALVFAVVRFARRLGDLASTAAAVALAASFPIAKCAGLARTDMLLAAATTLAAAELFESFCEHELGSGKAARHLLAASAFAAIGTVAKSPVALVLPVVAAAVFRVLEPRARHWTLALGPRTWLLAGGIYFLIVGAWFVPALLSAGDPLYETFKSELLGHAVGAGEYGSPDKAQPFYYPFTHFASKFLPWTLVLLAPVAGAPRIFAGTLRRDAAPGSRVDLGGATAIFAFAALVGGLAIFALPKIKRQDHVVPCYPWAAILVGAVLARWRDGTLPPRSERLVSRAFWLVGVCALDASVLLPLALSGNRIADALGARETLRSHGWEWALDTLGERPWLVLALALLSAPAGALAWSSARTRRGGAALLGTALATALAIVLYEHALSEAVVTGKGTALPSFCARARALAGDRKLAFYGVPGSVPFYFERSQRSLYSADEAVAALESGARALVTNRIGAEEVLERRPDLEPAVSSRFYLHGDGPPRVAVWQLVLLVPPGELPREDRSGWARIWW